jgi:peptide deformylase
MPVLPVLKFPDPLLRRKAKPVREFDGELAALARAMLETMYAEGGIGLAAPQVGQSRQLIVVDLHAGEEDRSTRAPRVYVNPSILEREGEIVTEEGCLSVPEFTAEVTRARRIRVHYQTLEGESREETLEELAAVCLQHEIDHLQGRLFVDHLPLVKRQLVKKRLMKLAESA